MAIQEHQNGEEKPYSPLDVAEHAGLVDQSRRNFTKSGFVASGVLLTLASRPVLGQVVCQTPSGFISGNVSPHGTPPVCLGLSPGYFGNQPQDWPSPYLPGAKSTSQNGKKSPSTMPQWTGGTMFKDVFSCSNNGAKYKPYSMMEVIWLQGSDDPYQLGAHIVAALLNAKKGWTPVLTEAQVINIFNEWDQYDYFTPTAGVKWYGPDIVTYLQKSTMT